MTLYIVEFGDDIYICLLQGQMHSCNGPHHDFAKIKWLGLKVLPKRSGTHFLNRVL